MDVLLLPQDALELAPSSLNTGVWDVEWCTSCFLHFTVLLREPGRIIQVATLSCTRDAQVLLDFLQSRMAPEPYAVVHELIQDQCSDLGDDPIKIEAEFRAWRREPMDHRLIWISDPDHPVFDDPSVMQVVTLQLWQCESNPGLGHLIMVWSGGAVHIADVWSKEDGRALLSFFEQRLVDMTYTDLEAAIERSPFLLEQTPLWVLARRYERALCLQCTWANEMFSVLGLGADTVMDVDLGGQEGTFVVFGAQAMDPGVLRLGSHVLYDMPREPGTDRDRDDEPEH